MSALDAFDALDALWPDEPWLMVSSMSASDGDTNSTNRVRPPTPRCRCGLGAAFANLPWMT